MLNKWKELREKSIQELEKLDAEHANSIMRNIEISSFMTGFSLAATIVIVGKVCMDHMLGIPFNSHYIIVSLILSPLVVFVCYFINSCLCGIFWDGFVKKHVLPSSENEDGQVIGQKDKKKP